MKKLLYILPILFYSCGDLHEQTDALPYDFLVSEAWDYFQNGDYEKSEELFYEILNIEEELLPYYSEGYLGIGWSKLYQAKTLASNSDNFYQILSLEFDQELLTLVYPNELKILKSFLERDLKETGKRYTFYVTFIFLLAFDPFLTCRECG